DRVEVLLLGGLVDRADELAPGEQGGRPCEGGQAEYHLGVYPCLPLNTKPDGSRSSRVAMTFRLVVSWRSSRMVIDSSFSPVSVKFLTGPLLSPTSLLSWPAALSMFFSATRASVMVLLISLGSLPANAFRLAASCGPSSRAMVFSDSVSALTLSNV